MKQETTKSGNDLHGFVASCFQIMPVPCKCPRLSHTMIASRLPFLVALLGTAAFAADFPQPFNTEKDLSIPLMPAEEAAAKFQVPPGFKVSVFASEPDVQNPIAMSWDARGRLWVAEN